MRRFLTFAFVASALALTVPHTVSAQVRLGGGLGYEFDLKEDWLHIGADVRFVVPNSHWEINPRLLFNPGGGYNVMQADVNLLYNLDLASTKKVVPYFGAGILVQRLSFEEGRLGDISEPSETKAGVNFIAGARLNPKGPIAPFATMAYSVINEQGNNMVLFLGVHWTLKK